MPLPPSLRIVSLMEADSVTGPAKNMIQFGRSAGPADETSVCFSFLSYDRKGNAARNTFVSGARQAGLEVDLIRERGPFDPRVIPQMRRLIGAANPHIVQTHNVKSHFLMRLSGLWRDYRWLAFHHGYTWVDAKMRLYNQLDRWSLRVPDHLVAVCGPFAEQLKAYGVAGRRISVLHNSAPLPAAVDREAVEALRRRHGLTPETVVLVAVGRLSSEKGHLDLIRAIASLEGRAGLPPFHLLIVGEGPMRGSIKDRCRGSYLALRVTLTGHQADVGPYYAAADLLVMPSRTEGSPNALLEAMAHGVAVLATRAGGIPEIVTSGESAWLVETGDADSLTEALCRLLVDAALRRRLAAEALRLVKERYTPEQYRRRLLDIYRLLLCRSRQGAGNA